jgi:hypothetical protein
MSYNYLLSIGIVFAITELMLRRITGRGVAYAVCCLLLFAVASARLIGHITGLAVEHFRAEIGKYYRTLLQELLEQRIKVQEPAGAPRQNEATN